MSFWLIDPELFLYAKGTDPHDVHLWRCKKPASSSSSSSLVVSMKSDDFDYVSNVKNHLELIGDMFDWDEPDYKRLVKYIYQRRLLLNCQGLVIVEIYKLDDSNEVPIYIRSLDVLALKTYIPKLRERSIPFRTVKYLGDVNGKTAMMEEKQDSNVTNKLTARVEHLEAENIRLESNNKILEGKITKLTTDLTTQTNANTKEEVWMNDLTNNKWISVEGLPARSIDDLIIVGQQSTYTEDDSSTNIRARYWCTVKLYASVDWEYLAVSLEDLTPNKERARFLRENWSSFQSKGKTYVCRLP